MVSQACLPHLLKVDNPHILNIAFPLNLSPGWFGRHMAYTMAKFCMSLCVLGMAEELKEQGVAANAFWPVSTVATTAIQNLLGGDEMLRQSRKPVVMGDAAHAILVRDRWSCTGNFYTDEEVLKQEGVTDLTHYALDPTVKLKPDTLVKKDWTGA